MAVSRAKLMLRIGLFAGTAISLFFVPWILVWAWLKPLPDSIPAQLDETLNYGFAGVIVFTDSPCRGPQLYAAGYDNLETLKPASPDALFKIASISKLYVAVAIAKLADKQQLSLDQTLIEYFPELQNRIENASDITLRQLVQHRSGIPNFTDNPLFWQEPVNSGRDPLDFAIDLPATFAPGDGYQYSNTNYLLLRRIIEKRVGYDHFQYIKEQILDPLDLKNTFGSLKEVDLEKVMSGYYVGVEGDFKTHENGMLATANDVGLFLRSLNDGSVFSGNEQQIYRSIYEYEHGGLVPGYQSLAEYHADIDTVFVQFMNTTNFDGYEWNLSQITMGRLVDIERKNIEKNCH